MTRWVRRCKAALGGALIGALMATAPAWAGEAVLQLEGPGAYHTLRVPPEVESQAERADLRDLQVLNARGEALPFAWAEAPPTQAIEQRRSVPFFRAPAAASAVHAAQQGGWIIDARRAGGTLLSLHLQLPAVAEGVYGFVLERSDDLQQWQTVRPAVQLFSLRHENLRLDNPQIDLGGLPPSYLRLRPLPGSTPPPLAAVHVTGLKRSLQIEPLQWTLTLPPLHCTPTQCDYLVPRHLRAEQVHVLPTEANALARVRLWAGSKPSAAQASRHDTSERLRERVKAIRHKARTPADASARHWTPLQDATVYWLKLPQGEVRSEPIAVRGVAAEMLRLEVPAGMAQLGAETPTLRIASRPRTLVFLARGPAPYKLAWGGPAATAELPLSQLMPSRQADDPLPESIARLAEPLPETTYPPTRVAAPPTSTPDARRGWLWGVLVLGLAAMGAMAWSLLRRKKTAPPA